MKFLVGGKVLSLLVFVICIFVHYDNVGVSLMDFVRLNYFYCIVRKPDIWYHNSIDFLPVCLRLLHCVKGMSMSFNVSATWWFSVLVFSCQTPWTNSSGVTVNLGIKYKWCVKNRVIFTNVLSYIGNDARHIVTVFWAAICYVSNSDIASNLEWPLKVISGTSVQVSCMCHLQN